MAAARRVAAEAQLRRAGRECSLPLRGTSYGVARAYICVNRVGIFYFLSLTPFLLFHSSGGFAGLGKYCTGGGDGRSRCGGCGGVV